MGFLSHLIDLFASRSGFDIDVIAKGDLWIDDHHMSEDIGITLGETVRKILKDGNGIKRYATAILPMDEVLCLVSIDFSGRSCLSFKPVFSREKVGDFSTECVEEFFQGFTRSAGATVHIWLIEQGRNDHHRIEAIFKAFGAALGEACLKTWNKIPSTKGVLL